MLSSQILHHNNILSLVTSSSKNKLRALPIPKLRAYMKAYNIRAPGAAVEKDDLVEAILRSKVIIRLRIEH